MLKSDLCDSSDIFCYLGHIPIGNTQNSKNLYDKNS